MKINLIGITALFFLVAACGVSPSTDNPSNPNPNSPKSPTSVFGDLLDNDEQLAELNYPDLGESYVELKLANEIVLEGFDIYDLEWTFDGEFILASDLSGGVYAIDSNTYSVKKIFDATETALQLASIHTKPAIEAHLALGGQTLVSINSSDGSLAVINNLDDYIHILSLDKWNVISSSHFQPEYVSSFYSEKYMLSNDFQIGYGLGTSHERCLFQVGANPVFDAEKISNIVYDSMVPPDVIGENWAHKCFLSPDGQLLAAFNSYNQMTLWGVESEEKVFEFNSPCEGGATIAANANIVFSQDMRVLYFPNCSSTLWDLDTFEIVGASLKYLSSASFTADNKYLIGISDGPWILDIWQHRPILVENKIFYYKPDSEDVASAILPSGYDGDFQEGAWLWTSQDGEVGDLVVSPNDNRFAVGFSEGRIRVYEIVSHD